MFTLRKNYIQLIFPNLLLYSPLQYYLCHIGQIWPDAVMRDVKTKFIHSLIPQIEPMRNPHCVNKPVLYSL